MIRNNQVLSFFIYLKMNGETQSHRLFAAFLQFLGLSVEFQPWNMIKGPLMLHLENLEVGQLH